MAGEARERIVIIDIREPIVCTLQIVLDSDGDHRTLQLGFPSRPPALQRFECERSLSWVMCMLLNAQVNMETADDVLARTPAGPVAEFERALLTAFSAWQTEQADALIAGRR